MFTLLQYHRYFFVNDSVDPNWRVVLRHDPRRKRIEGDRDVQIFGAVGSARPTLSTRSGATPQPAAFEPPPNQTDEVIPPEQFNSLIHKEEHPEDDRHLEDTQFEDEVEIMCVQ